MASHKDPNSRPQSPEPLYQFIPFELAKLCQWVLWRFDWSTERGEWAKVPYQTNGRRASSTDSSTWATMPIVVNALETAKASYDGIGFVFTSDSPYIGIDLDECVAQEDGKYNLTAFAARVVEKLASYTEFSPSKTGLHIIGKASEMAAMRTEWNGNKIEVYRTGRYFTFTGASWHDVELPVRDVHSDISEIIEKLRPAPQMAAQASVQSSNARPLIASVSLTVEDRIRLALRNVQCATLFGGDISACNGDGTQSPADFALCRLLAYYCGGSAETLDAMFRQSKLMRGKWDERRGDSTYGGQTIAKILEGQRVFLETKSASAKTKTDSSYESRRMRRFSMDDLWDAAMAYRHSGGNRGVDPGWTPLEKIYRPRRGLMTVVTGEPGSGKSTFVDCLVANIAMVSGWVTTFASFETQPLQRHILDLCQIHLGIPTFAFVNGSATDEQMEQAREVLRPFFHFIMPDDDELNLDAILDYVDDEIRDFGIAGFVLDPWSELDNTRDLRVNQTDFIESGLRNLRRFTRQRDIHTWLIAHPTKSGDTYKNGRPTLRSISGCYSDDTEVLTFNGWKLHCDVLPEDKIGCFNLKDSSVEWHLPSFLTVADYDGDMVHFTGRSMDCLVTPNHRMVVKPGWDHEPVDPYDSRILSRNWQFREAREISSTFWFMPYTARFSSFTESYFEPDIPELSMYNLDAFDDFLRLLGWWISEGCTQSGGLSMCQAAGELADEMEECLNRLGLKHTSTCDQSSRPHEKPMYKTRIWKSAHPELCLWVIANCKEGAPNKKLPDMAWTISNRQKQILLDSLIDGDGSRYESGNIKYSTTSKQLADDVQRLALELGYPTAIGTAPGAEAHHLRRYTVHIGKLSRSQISLMPSKQMKSVPYKGKVFCFTVPTGAYITRRNGRVAFQGNSAHYYNKADYGLVIHRTDANDTTVYVDKVRFGETGTRGEVAFRFDIDARAYYPVVAMPQAEPPKNWADR